MAGLQLVPFSSGNLETENPKFSSIIDQWEVQYGRFFYYGATNKFSSTHPSIKPIPAPHRKRLRGTWISTDAANLKLQYQSSTTGSDEAVLVVSVTSRVIEEHYVSKMHFSWPQVSCVAARGSKAVFVNYKDREGQIQKFAVWFSTVTEAEKFMNTLEAILGNGRVKRQQCSEFTSEISSQAEVVPLEVVLSDELGYRPYGDYLQHATSANNSNQDLVSQEMVQIPEASMTMSAFPPSFSELVKNCHLTVDEAKPTDSGDNLKSQFMQYMEGSSLKELMATIEGVISDFGDDIMF